MTRPEIPPGATCDHPSMHECHEGCGHWFCDEPGCGLSFDEQGEGGPRPETHAERQAYLAEQLADMGGA